MFKNSHTKVLLLRARVLRALVLMALATLGACSGTRSTPSPDRVKATPPNILFLLADDLGYADLGSYGNRIIATPHLDRLASEGLRFTSFYTSGPTCTPTRVSLMTGLYPQRLGVYSGLRVESTWGLPPDSVTLPRRLQGAGYETIHIGKWHLGHAEVAQRPLALGFDRFFGFLHAHHLPKTYWDPQLRRDEQPEASQLGYLTDLLTDEAISFLRSRKNPGRPFFLNLWYFNPHKPLQPPPRWAERYNDTVEGRYAAQVSALDEAIGRLLKELDTQQLARDTLVVFMSDNGGVNDIHRGHNGPFQGGKTQLFEGGIRAPLLIRWPERVAANTVSDALTASFDLFPTLSEAAKVRHTETQTDGRSLLPMLKGRSDDFEGPLFWEDHFNNQRRFAVRDGRWKLHSDGSQTTLSDLQEDPGETIDLAAERPEIFSRLIAAHQQWRSQLPPIAGLSEAGDH